MNKKSYQTLYKNRLSVFNHLYKSIALDLYDHFQDEADDEEVLTVVLNIDDCEAKIYSSFDKNNKIETHDGLLSHQYTIKDLADEFILQYGSDNFIYGLMTVDEIVDMLKENFGSVEEVSVLSVVRFVEKELTNTKVSSV